eukprot:3938769-Rhodomonas_salina.1
MQHRCERGTVVRGIASRSFPNHMHSTPCPATSRDRTCACVEWFLRRQARRSEVADAPPVIYKWVRGCVGRSAGM